MTDVEREVVENVLEGTVPDSAFVEYFENRVVVSDPVVGDHCFVNVSAVREFCTLDELADYTRTVVTDFYEKLSERHDRLS